MEEYITIALPKGKLFKRSRDLLARVDYSIPLAPTSSLGKISPDIMERIVLFEKMSIS